MPSSCLEILSMLHPSSVDTTAIAPGDFSVPRINNPVVRGTQGMSKQDKKSHAVYVANFRNALRNGDKRTSSSRGGRKQVSITPQDVAGALAGLDDLSMLFALNFAEIARDDARRLFAREVFKFGSASADLDEGVFAAFDDVTKKEFCEQVFWPAWGLWMNGVEHVGLRSCATACGCSTNLARRIRPVLRAAIVLFQYIETDVCGHLRWQLFEKAA